MKITVNTLLNVKTDFSDCLQSYNSSYLFVLQVACFLDPRFKEKYLSEDELEDEMPQIIVLDVVTYDLDSTL